jgi:outer membrane protein assembly factor BamA
MDRSDGTGMGEVLRLVGRGRRLAVALLLLLPAVPSPASAQTPTRPEVVSLGFEGNDSFSATALSNAIATRATACRSLILGPFCWTGREFALDRSFLNPGVFRDDYIRLHLFYQRAGFRGVQVDTVVTRHDDNTAELLFQVREGEPHRITTLSILGLQDVQGSAVRENLPVSIGDRLDFLALDATRDTLVSRLRNEGFAHAEVFRSLFLPTGLREAEVEFDVYAGPRAAFGPITVEGNELVDARDILRMLPFQEGTVYNQELLFEAQRNLYSLEIFRHASITPDLGYEDQQVVPLRVTVNEGDSHRVRSGGGWNTAECFSAEARWSSLNYFGGARRLVLRGRSSNLLAHTLEDSVCSGAGTGVYGDLNWLVSADFTQPFIFSPRNSFSASVYAERQSLQDVFVRRAFGLNVGMTRSLGRATPLTISYRPQVAQLDAAEIFFCTSFLICDPLDIDILQGANLLSPLGLSFSRDRTNRVISPTGGYTFLADVEHASGATGSDFQYDRFVAEGTGFYGVFDGLVLAARLRAGWMQAGEFRGLQILDSDARIRVAHPQKRFYAGGSNSVRGFAQNQLGPQVVSTEVENLVFPVGSQEEAVCLPEEIVALTCDAAGLEQERFFLRPAGGSRLIEGSLELRFPIWGNAVGGAAFVDFGRVRDGGARIDLSDMAMTPGFGLRYSTPIGPLRFDVAYRPPERSNLPVVTSQLRPFDPETDSPGMRVRSGEMTLDWVRMQDLALLAPSIPFDERSESFWQRLQIHLSIGQAF